MVTMRQGNSQARGNSVQAPLAKGMGWGFIGGLVGTAVMDLILMGTLWAVGSPALACFSIVGDTGARFFLVFGIKIAGGVSLGLATHYLVGPTVGVIFGLALVKVDSLRVDTLKKCIVIAILYVEILSQPLLATTPILLDMTAAETLQWFGGSFVMHFILAIVLGAVVGCGLRVANAANGITASCSQSSN